MKIKEKTAKWLIGSFATIWLAILIWFMFGNPDTVFGKGFTFYSNIVIGVIVVTLILLSEGKEKPKEDLSDWANVPKGDEPFHVKTDEEIKEELKKDETNEDNDTEEVSN